MTRFYLDQIKPIYPKKNITFVAFIATASLISVMVTQGFQVRKHPFEPDQYLVPSQSLDQPKLWELLQDDNFIYIASVTFLVSPTGSNQTFNIPGNWNSSNNKVECIGAGGSGGAIFDSSGTSSSCGGGGGAYSAQTNITLVPGGTLTYQIGSAGAAVSNNSNGNTGGDSWFNGATLGASTVGAKGGGGGAQAGVGGASGGAGGAAASGVGATKNSGGRGGNDGGSDAAATGGGGAAGPNGNGNQGVDVTGAFQATNGGSGDNGSGGSAGAGVVTTGVSAAGGNGGNGTEFDASHGCGGGGGAARVGNANGGATAVGGTGGNYGGGGGGGMEQNFASATSGAGTQGLIVVTNNVATRGIYAAVMG